MLHLPSKLCETCQGFDVRDALLNAEKKTAVPARRSGDLVRPGLKRYFAVHDNLSTLKACALSGNCELCKVIWNSYISVKYPPGIVISEEELQRGVGTQPVFLATGDWNLSKEEPVRLVVQQYDSAAQNPATTRQLASFDVCAPYGQVARFSHMRDVI